MAKDDTGTGDTGGNTDGGNADAVAAAAAAAAAAASGADGGQAPVWHDGVSADNLAFIEANGYADLDTALTANRHAQSLVGMDKGHILKAPTGDDIASDDFQAYFDAGGRPESAEKYGDLPTIEGMDGLSEAQTGAFNKMAYDAGLSTAQRAAMYQGYAGMVQENIAAEDAQLKQFQTEGLDALRKEYGLQFEQAAAGGKAMMRKYFGAEFAEALDDTQLGNDPRLIGGFMKLAKEFSEPGVGAGDGRGSGIMTPGEANAELAKFEVQYEKALHDAGNSNHDWAVKRRMELIEFAHPDGK